MGCRYERALLGAATPMFIGGAVLDAASPPLVRRRKTLASAPRPRPRPAGRSTAPPLHRAPSDTEVCAELEQVLVSRRLGA